MDARDAYGQTALHCATYEGHVKVVESLLNAKAQPHAQDLVLGSAIDIARNERPRHQKKLLKLLTQAAPSGQAGRVVGLSSALENVCGIVAPPCVGLLFEAYGDAAGALVAAGFNVVALSIVVGGVAATAGLAAGASAASSSTAAAGERKPKRA